MVMIKKKSFCEICQIEVCSLYTHKHCPNCGVFPEFQEVRNYSMMWLMCIALSAKLM